VPVDPYRPPSLDSGARVYDRLADLEQRLRNIEAYLQGGTVQQVPVVAALPAAGREGRVLKVSGDSRLWVDTGVAWEAV
jgi:hypothetical protein